jgi:succinyl-CoA synthetase beta subunit
MNIRQKNYLKKYNVPVQEGIAVESVMAAEEAYRQIKTQTNNNFAVIKAQIHAGGRGKGKVNESGHKWCESCKKFRRYKYLC